MEEHSLWMDWDFLADVELGMREEQLVLSDVPEVKTREHSNRCS